MNDTSKEYVIYYMNGTKREYITTLYSDSISTTSKISNAAKFKSVEIAKAIIEQINTFNSGTYFVGCIEVTFSTIE